MTTGGLRALVTGATSGLGREVAVQLGGRGAKVAITGRRESALRETGARVREAGGECLELVGSVAVAEDVRRHYAAVRERWGGLDWAILNAGISENVNGVEFDAALCRGVFETNVFGVANWLEATLPDMLASGRGVIAGIASLAAFRGIPGHGAYSASKAAVVNLLESVRIDLKGTGVRVVTVCPGYVKSEMTSRNDPKDMAFLMETVDGARAVLDGIESGRRVAHFPWQLSYPVLYVLPNVPDALYEWAAWKARPRRKKPPQGRGRLES